VDNTPLNTSQQPASEALSQPSDMHHRTRSTELVEDSHLNILDEDPLLISQTLTYVTDDGSVLHSFQSAPFSFCTFILLRFVIFKRREIV
jgi:hypothetical protein